MTKGRAMDELERMYGYKALGFDTGALRCLGISGTGLQCKLDAMYGNLCQVHYRLAETRADRLTIRRDGVRLLPPGISGDVPF